MIVDSNEQLVDNLVKNNYTVYGSIAYSIEQNRSEIDRTAEQIAAYFAEHKALQITKEYEETRSFSEKWIRNDPIKLKQMEIKRNMATDATSSSIQWTIKGGIWVIEKALERMDNIERKKSLWGLCLSYANYITDGNIEKRRALTAIMFNIHQQLFPNKFHKKKTPDLFSTDLPDKVWIPSNKSEAERAAFILYTIYSVAHYMCCDNNTKERDFEKLIEFWMYMGIWGNSQIALLKNFELLDKGNALEYGRLNTVIQSFYNNLSIAVPNIDKKISRTINTELLKYVPNGDKQLAVRRTAGIVTKAAITAAAGIVGNSTANPVLLNVAATSATALIGDLRQTEIIGNCLAESGIDEKSVKECIELAQRKQLTTTKAD